MVTIRLSESGSVRTQKRLRRHGDEYDVVLEHHVNGKSAPMGLLCKSRKTKKYVWFSRSKIVTIENDPVTHKIPVPTIIEGLKSTTPDEQLLHEYLDHLMNKVLSKRDQKRYATLYDKIKINQPSLIDRINNGI
jgi:hypothetical protein